MTTPGLISVELRQGLKVASEYVNQRIRIRTDNVLYSAIEDVPAVDEPHVWACCCGLLSGEAVLRES